MSTFFPLLLLFSILTAGWWVTPQDIQNIPLCLMRTIFHFDCPGCGMTRSFLSIARGHLWEAFQYNAAGPLIYTLLTAYFIESLIRLRLPQFRWSFSRVASVFFSTSVGVLLLGHWIIRISSHIFS